MVFAGKPNTDIRTLQVPHLPLPFPTLCFPKGLKFILICLIKIIAICECTFEVFLVRVVSCHQVIIQSLFFNASKTIEKLLHLKKYNRCGRNKK